MTRRCHMNNQQLCILFLFAVMAVANALAMSPPPPEPSPEPVIPQVDPIPGTPSLSVDLSKTGITLSWNATPDAEYYPVYVYTGGQWHHIEDNRSTQVSYNHKRLDWSLNELKVKTLACKLKPWWLFWAWWEHNRCSNWSNTETALDSLNPKLRFTHDNHNIDSELKYYLIWELQQVYDNAKLAIYYDSDNNGYDGILLIDNLNANALRHDLNTSAMPAGDYYVYAVMTSHGRHYTSYSPHVVRVENNQVETITAVIEVTEQQQQQITQIIHNGNQGGSIQIAASAVPPTWQPDSIIVIPPSTRLKSGLSMKVKEVTTNNNQATVTYAQPTFDEVMGKVSIRIDTPLKPNMNDLVVTTATKSSPKAKKASPQQSPKPVAPSQLINFVTPDMQHPAGAGSGTNSSWFPDAPSVRAGWDSDGNIALQLNELMVYRSGENSLKLSGGLMLGEPSIKYEFDYDSFNPNELHTSLELNYRLKQALTINATLDRSGLSASEIANKAKQQNKYLCGNSLGVGSGSVEISGATWPQTDVCLTKLSIGLGKIALKKKAGGTVLTPLALEIYLIMGADLHISALGAIDMSKDSQNNIKMVLSPRDNDYQLNATASNNNWLSTAEAQADGQAQIYTGVAPAIYTLGIYPVVMRAYTGVDINARTWADYPYTHKCVRITGDLLHGLTASLGLNISMDFDLFGWTPAEGVSANYSKALANPFGNIQLFKQKTGNCLPRIDITAPAFNTTIENSYLITWTAKASHPAKISLYYDTAKWRSDSTRTLITNNLIQGTDTSYLWDISTVPEGDYYILAKIDDGVNRPAFAYSDGIVIVPNSENIGRYTRLDANGNLYTGNGDYNSNPWACVRDNHTGLIWEVKTNDRGIHGRRGFRWGGKTAEAWNPRFDSRDYDDYFAREYFESMYGEVYNESHYAYNAYYEDWDILVDDSNNKSLCGSSAWRLPTMNELRSLSIRPHSIHSSFDFNYFPHMNTDCVWSSSPAWWDSISAMCWDFYYQDELNPFRLEETGVVLVSGGN